MFRVGEREMSDQDDRFYIEQQNVYYGYQAPPSAGFAILILLYGAYDYVSNLIAPYWEMIAAFGVIAAITVALLALAGLTAFLTFPLARKMAGEQGWNKGLWKMSFFGMATAIVTILGLGMIFSANFEAIPMDIRRVIFIAAAPFLAVAIQVVMFSKRLGFKQGGILGVVNLVAFCAIVFLIFPRNLLS